MKTLISFLISAMAFGCTTAPKLAEKVPSPKRSIAQETKSTGFASLKNQEGPPKDFLRLGQVEVDLKKCSSSIEEITDQAGGTAMFDHQYSCTIADRGANIFSLVRHQNYTMLTHTGKCQKVLEGNTFYVEVHSAGKTLETAKESIKACMNSAKFPFSGNDTSFISTEQFPFAIW